MPPAGASTIDVRATPSSDDAAAPPAAAGRETVVVELVASEEAFCARTESGAVWCWGRGVNGELGNGALDARWRPVRVQGIRRASKIAATANRVCAIDEGRVFCWGASFEERGGFYEPRATPAPVGDERDVVDVAVGFPHVCMIHRGGRVTCRALYPKLSSAASARDMAGPATAIIGTKDDGFSTQTAEGVVTFRHGTIASGAAHISTIKEKGPLATKVSPTLTNEEGRCELANGAVSCGDREKGSALKPMPIGEPSVARTPNTIAPELDAKEARVVGARLGEAGEVSFCVALARTRYPWVVTNRQCFTFDETKRAFSDAPAWTPRAASGTWTDDGVEIESADGTRRTVKLPHIGGGDDARLDVARSGRSALATLRDPNKPSHTVAFYDLEAGKQLWKKTQQAHLDEWFFATNDFAVNVYTDVMGNDGHYTIALTSRTGARVVTTGDAHVAAADEGDMATHKGFSEASPRHVATWGSTVTLHALDAPSEATSFKVPATTEIVLYDEKRRRIVALSDAPLGTVTIFDRAKATVTFSGAPAR